MEEKMLEKILIENVLVTVFFDYQPAEPMTDTYPGCGSSVELNSVCLIKNDLMPVLNQSALSELADRCLESIEDDKERS